jgi:hypothetical protein
LAYSMRRRISDLEQRLRIVRVTERQNVVGRIVEPRADKAHTLLRERSTYGVDNRLRNDAPELACARRENGLRAARKPREGVGTIRLTGRASG